MFNLLLSSKSSSFIDRAFATNINPPATTSYKPVSYTHLTLPTKA